MIGTGYMSLLGLSLTKYHKLNDNFFFVTVLKFRSMKSRWWSGWFFLRTMKKYLFHVCPLASDDLLVTWHSLTYRSSNPIFGSSLHSVLLVYICLQFSPFCKDTSLVGLDIYPIPVLPLLNYICNDCISK